MDPTLPGALIGLTAGNVVGLIAILILDWWTGQRHVRRLQNILYVPPVSLRPPPSIVLPGRICTCPLANPFELNPDHWCKAHPEEPA